VPGKLDTQTILKQVERFKLKPKEIYMQVERKHIFTHIEWHMCGVYVEVADCTDNFLWVSEGDTRREIALPTAFRLFLPEERLNFFNKNSENNV
jgi:A/G-specific adenine glycosylase